MNLAAHSCTIKFTLNYFGHEELWFFMANGANFKCQELAPNIVKNPSFSQPSSFLGGGGGGSYKNIVGGTAPHEFKRTRMCSRAQVQPFFFVFFIKKSQTLLREFELELIFLQQKRLSSHVRPCWP